MSLVAKMQTQDHVKPNHSGNDGHGGVHVCHKCGWPYSNPHPSSKIRRAHKKVCGTIGKYRQDNNAKDKTHVEGYDGAPPSDDEFKISSVGRTISRGSNSGVGSISEEDVFTDTITEFSESPAVLAREASDGVMQRFYSMQRANEFEDTKLAEENPIAGEDSLCTTDRLKNNQLQTVQIMVGQKDKLEAVTESHAHISDNPSLVSAVVTPEIGNAIDQNVLQSSELSNELNVVSERVQEIISGKVEPELRNSFTRTPEEVAGDERQGPKNERLTSVSLEGLDHIFDANLSNADINVFKSEAVEELKSENSENRKNGGTEEKKPIASIGSISLEGATRDARETTSNTDSLRSDLDDDGEYFTVIHNDGSKVSQNGDITVQDSRNFLISDSNSNGNITLEGAILNGVVVSDGAAAENVEEIESSDKNARVGEGMVDSGADATLKSHDHLNSISKDVDENVKSSSITDGDKLIKHAATVSGVESIIDSGSMADSLDANWGSFSDPIATANTIASNHPRTAEGEGIESMGPKPVTENQLSQSQVSEINQMEHNSEIHSSTEQHLPNSGDMGKGVLVDENTPLKTLLGEATAQAHQNQSSSSTFASQNDVISSTNDGSLAKGETVINNSEHPEIETVQSEMEKEWNSPARYPVKRTAKTRASWMPFFCCSSVNAR